MIDKHIIEYIFSLGKRDLIEPKDVSAMIAILEASYLSGWSSTVEISQRELANGLGVSVDTFSKYVDRLELAGLISRHTERGKRTKIRITFLDDLFSTRHLKKYSRKSMNEVMKDHVPGSESRLYTYEFSTEKEEKTPENSDLVFRSPGKKSDLKSRSPEEGLPKNMDTYSTVSVLRIYTPEEEENRGVIKNRSLKEGGYLISMSLFIPGNSFRLKELMHISDEKYAKLSKFFSAIYIEFNKTYLEIINAVDQIFFAGKLTDTIEDIINRYKTDNSPLKRKDGVLLIDNATLHKFIPSNLMDHKEFFRGEETTFTEAIEKWLVYIDRKPNKEVNPEMIEEVVKYAASLNEPVKSIRNSITQGWPSIYEYKEEESSKHGKELSDEELGIDPSLRGHWARG